MLAEWLKRSLLVSAFVKIRLLLLFSFFFYFNEFSSCSMFECQNQSYASLYSFSIVPYCLLKRTCNIFYQRFRISLFNELSCEITSVREYVIVHLEYALVHTFMEFSYTVNSTLTGLHRSVWSLIPSSIQKHSMCLVFAHYLPGPKL